MSEVGGANGESPLHTADLPCKRPVSLPCYADGGRAGTASAATTSPVTPGIKDL